MENSFKSITKNFNYNFMQSKKALGKNQELFVIRKTPCRVTLVWFKY